MTSRPLPLFLRGVARWLFGLTGLGLLFQVISAPPLSGHWSGMELAWRLPGVIGLLLPFTAFAGGLSLHGVTRTVRTGLLYSGLLVLPAYGLLSYGQAISTYRAAQWMGVDVQQAFPLGPSTPGQIHARRAAVRANPPQSYSFQGELPHQTPPNWLTYLLHSPAALALFSILAALLGQQVGFLTTGLSPPLARRNARWAFGLFSSLAFFIAHAAGGEWVRADPSHSGLIGAWAPFVVPLLELALITFLARRRSLHGRPDSSVS